MQIRHWKEGYLKIGEPVFFAVFKNDDIVIHESVIEDSNSDHIVLRGWSGWIPYEWAGKSKLEAVEALRNRSIRDLAQTAMEGRALAQQAVAASQLYVDMSKEST